MTGESLPKLAKALIPVQTHVLIEWVIAGVVERRLAAFARVPVNVSRFHPGNRACPVFFLQSVGQGHNL
jgi:trehalose utilization protein